MTFENECYFIWAYVEVIFHRGPMVISLAVCGHS